MFDTHIIQITTEEAAQAFESGNCFFHSESLKYYEALIQHFAAAYPQMDENHHRMFALAAVWHAGHLQGIYERTTFQKRTTAKARRQAA